MKNKYQVYSQAFPIESKQTKSKMIPFSTIHSILPSLTINPELIQYKPISKTYLDEIQKLHKEWFPINYDKDYFSTVLSNEYHNFYSIIATYPHPNESDELILGCLLMEMQPISYKFKDHSSNEILSKISNEITFTDDMNCTLTFNDYLCGYIMTIGVVDECRRMKLGSTLISKAIDICLNNDLCVCLYLDVVTYNETAIKFYRKNNFEEVTTIKNYYHVYGNVYDSYVYVRVFTNKEKSLAKRKRHSTLYIILTQYLSMIIHVIVFILTMGLCFKNIRKKHKLD